MAAEPLSPTERRDEDRSGQAEAGKESKGKPRVTFLSDDSSPSFAESLPSRLGDYEILSILGRGGHGTVYLARHPEHGEVALKVLSPELGGSALRARRFLREIELAGRFDHPHLVKILDHGQVGGTHFYAMPVVCGRNIRDTLDSLPRQEGEDEIWWTRLAQLGAELMDALSYIHQRGIVHRDLKPENVMVDGNGGVKLVDFGLARSLEDPSDLTRTGTVVGTVNYLSPEQINGGAVDQRSDIFALGVLLLELIAGRHPFAGPHTMATMKNILVEDPVLPNDLAPALADCLRKCLAKQAAKRFSDCSEVRAQWTEGMPASSGLRPGPGMALRKPLDPGIQGRAGERLRLQGLVEKLGQGKPSRFHLEGIAGMGKSTLLADLMAELKASYVLILSGVCKDGTGLPCQPLRDALKPVFRVHPPSDSLRNGLAPLFPELASHSEEASAFTKWGLFDAIARWMEGLGRPVALVLDDLHWADSDTLAAIEFLSGRAEESGSPLLLLTGGRPGATFGEAELMVLEPLDEAAVTRLLEALLGAAVQPELSGYVYAHCHGHPMSVCQLVRSLLEESSLTHEPSGWSLSLSKDGRPPGILAVVRHRLHGLPQDWLALLYAAAVLGKTFALPALQTMIGQPEQDTLQAMESLCERGILTAGQSAPYGQSLDESSSDRHFAFSHDTFREAVLETLAPARRRELHAEAGRALQALGASATQVAQHFEAAGWVSQAREVYLQAGKEAQLGLAFERSAHLFTLAMESQDNPSAELREHLADALRCGGQPLRAVETYRGLLGGQVGMPRARLLWRIAECYCQAGENRAAYLSVVEALNCCGYHLPNGRVARLKVMAQLASGTLPPPPDPRGLAHSLYCTLAQFHYWINPPGWMLESLLIHSQIKRAEMHHLGRLGFFSHGLDAIVRLLAPVPMQESAMRHARMALETEKLEPDTPGKALTMSHLGQIFLDIGMETESREYLHRALDLAKHFASVEVLVDVSLGLSRFFEFQGDLALAEQHGRRALEFKTGFAVTRDVMHLQLARVLFMQGRLQEGEERMSALAFPKLPRVAQLIEHTLAWRDLHQGDYESALQRCARSREQARQLPPGPVFQHGTAFQELQALLGLKRYEQGLKGARKLAKTADRPAFAGTARRLEAELLLAMGRDDEARVALGQARELLRGRDRPFELRRIELMLERGHATSAS